MTAKFLYALVLYGSVAAGVALAETPITGDGLPPLPDAAPDSIRLDQLEQERSGIRAEARDLGGGRTIRESIRNTDGRVSDLRQTIQRFEEVAEDLGATVEDLEALKAETEASAPSAGGTPKQKAGRKAAEQIAKRALSTGLRRFFRIIGFAADAGEEAMLTYYKNTTKENFRQMVRSSQANLRDVNQVLTALYRDLGVELAKAQRLRDIDQRDSEIFREIAGIRGGAQVGGLPSAEPRLDRDDDEEYDQLLQEAENLRFKVKLAIGEGRRADAEILQLRINEIEDRLDELEDSPGPLGCGAGFFYIPGTDTCLQISGHVRYEYMHNPSDLGVGTARVGPMGLHPERFNTKADEYLNGIGGKVGFEYGLGQGEGGLRFGGNGTGKYGRFIFGDLSIGGGNAHLSGWDAIGENDVTLLGFTYAEALAPDNTGLSTGTAGFGLTGKTKIDYLGGEVELGYGQSYILGDPVKPSAFIWRGSFYYEGLEYDSDGRSDLTFDDMPYNGIFQSFDYESKDSYGGLKIAGAVQFHPFERLSVELGGNVKLGYHSGEADFRQVTGTGGGAEVDQRFHYEDDGFVVGGGLSLKADYVVVPGWTIGLGYAYDIVPEVTAANVPANPNEQPIEFSGESVDKHSAWFRVTGSF